MDWKLLLLLICPLMMLFCMKGMFSGHKKCETEQSLMSQQDIQALHSKMTEVIEQNASLVKEVQSLKEAAAVHKAGS